MAPHKQVAHAFKTVRDGMQHVVGVRHDEPRAVGQVQLADVIDALYGPHLVAGPVGFWKAVMDTVNDVFCHVVDATGDAVGLLQGFGASRQMYEMIYVSAAPNIDGLVVVACAVHAL